MPTNSRFWALQPEAAQTVFLSLRERLSHQPEPDASLCIETPPKVTTRYVVNNGVAVLAINGPITKTTRYYNGQPYTCGQSDIAVALSLALADTSVEAILLDIDSPGGIVPGTKELADSIASAAKVKPMASYANGLMTSAAMWLGAATGRVYSPVTSLVGSIGVIMVHADFSKFNERWGISYSYITGGRLKSAGNEDEPLSNEARALFQKQVTELHEIFKADVVRGLGVTAPAESWAEGQTMLAGEAKALGLVTDIVRDLSSAITKLRQEAVMDYQTLAAQHPELLAEIAQKAVAKAEEKLSGRFEANAAQQTDAAAKSAADNVLALVGIVAGEDMKAKISQLVAAEITPAQLKAVSTVLPKAEPPAPQDEEAKARAAILAGINAATQQPVPGAASAASPDAETHAAIERMSKM